MGVYTLTLAKLRTRVQHKLDDDTSPTRVDEWINDVLQQITSEVFFDELLVEDTASLVGDGVAQDFELPEDFAEFCTVFDASGIEPIDEVSPREMMEEWSYSSTPVAAPEVYTKLGRTGDPGDNDVPLMVLRFNAIPPDGAVHKMLYYRLHPELVDDTDYVLLPQNMLSIIVDGALMEADQWSDSEQYQVHRDRYTDKIDQLKRNQNRRPNRHRRMGTSVRNSKPGRPTFPSNYPRMRW